MSKPSSSAMALDVTTASRWFVLTKAIGSVMGMKALLLDKETMSMVGLVCSQTQVLEYQIYSIDRIDNEGRKSIGGFRAICILRPTSENVKALARELSEPKFDEYHLFFTNTIQDHQIQELAKSDTQQVVRQVQEIYMDFFPLAPDLFALNEPTCMPLEAPSWNHQLFDRVCDGLISVLLALKQNPTIVYQRNSAIAQRIAEEIEDRVATGNNTSDFDLFRFGNNNKSNTALLILDRRDDPVTPLLNHWTYTAMIHENLGIRNNRVDVSKVSNQKEQEVVLSVQDDEFYRASQHMVFGELGSALKEVVDEFQKHEGNSIASGAGRAKLQSIEDIQRFMENYPEFKRQEGMVAKHVTITSALSKVTSERNLFDMSELEQELACNENLTEAFNRVETFVEDTNVSLEDKLRLVLLYSLRYQMEGEREIRFLERSLKDCGIDDSLLRTVGLLRKYAGVAVRGSDIFNKNTVVGAAKTIVRKQMEGLKGVSNVLMRYEPLLQARLSAIKLAGLNALRENEFKILGQQKGAAMKPQNLIVFMVGGTSYAEARCVSEFNKEQQVRGMQVILGSNTVHNTRSFIQDIARMHSDAALSEGKLSSHE